MIFDIFITLLNHTNKKLHVFITVLSIIIDFFTILERDEKNKLFIRPSTNHVIVLHTFSFIILPPNLKK